jgi:superfamily I DNA/RNA helicase
VTAYEKFKEAHGLFDFTDCLEEFVKRGKPVPVKVAYIDEAQDLTKLQWQVCFTAFSQAEKIYLAGDDFQSIYTYAGAKPEFLIQFANKFPTIKLEVSYRLPQKVYKLSRAITELIGMKVEKDYVPFKDEEGVVELVNDRNLIARKVASKPDESWLILFRNNYHIPLFEKELQANLVLYHNSGGFCIGQNILSKIKKYLNFRKKGYSDPITAERFKKDYNITSFDNDIIDCALIESDKRYMAQSYLDKYGFDILEKTAIAKPKILVSTVHKVKGAEATNVVFFADCTKKVIENKSKDFDAELRVLYVAVTRAKKRLYLVRSQSNQGLDDILDVVMEEAEL